MRHTVPMPGESDQRILAVFGLIIDPHSPGDASIFRRGARPGAIVYMPGMPRPWGVCWTNNLDDAEMAWCGTVDTALRVLVRMT